jgi:hypothetical protein
MFDGYLKRRSPRDYRLGYKTEEEMWENTICVFHVPPDCGWFATRLQNLTWLVWTDCGTISLTKKFNNWYQAVQFLWNKFQEQNYPMEYWNPDDYEQQDDILHHEPNLEKYKF